MAEITKRGWLCFRARPEDLKAPLPCKKAQKGTFDSVAINFSKRARGLDNSSKTMRGPRVRMNCYYCEASEKSSRPVGGLSVNVIGV